MVCSLATADVVRPVTFGDKCLDHGAHSERIEPGAPGRALIVSEWATIRPEPQILLPTSPFLDRHGHLREADVQVSIDVIDAPFETSTGSVGALAPFHVCQILRGIAERPPEVSADILGARTQPTEVLRNEAVVGLRTGLRSTLSQDPCYLLPVRPPRAPVGAAAWPVKVTARTTTSRLLGNVRLFTILVLFRSKE